MTVAAPYDRCEEEYTTCELLTGQTPQPITISA